MVHADLYEAIRIDKDNGKSFQAIAKSRNQLVSNMLLRNQVQYMAVAKRRLTVALAELKGVRRPALVELLGKYYPGLPAEAAMEKALEPPPFMPAQVRRRHHSTTVLMQHCGAVHRLQCTW